jgi:hypothetical protein
MLVVCTLFDKVGFYDALRVVCTTDDYVFFLLQNCGTSRYVHALLMPMLDHAGDFRELCFCARVRGRALSSGALVIEDFLRFVAGSPDLMGIEGLRRLEGVMVDSLCWEAACSELDFLGEGDLERERGVSDCQ